MSSNSNMKKQEDKNVKILRELAALPQNKHCFDCNQRGPTYVNTTIGSFVCISCSGKLRGLTPPHRVKSISMASFLPEEIELLKGRGNEYCQRVWMGHYDTKSGFVYDTKDVQKFKDFLAEKYEKKRWYVEPSVALKSAPIQQTQSTQPTVATKSSTETKPLSSLLGTHAKPLVVASSTLTTNTNESSKGKLSSASSKSSADLLADLLASDSFSIASQTNTSHPSSTVPLSQPSFANFDNNPALFGNPLTSVPPSQTPTNQPTSALSTQGPPVANLPAPKARSSHGSPAKAVLAGHSSANQNGVPSEDKYAALKDLDSLFGTPTSSAPIQSVFNGNPKPASQAESDWPANFSAAWNTSSSPSRSNVTSATTASVPGANTPWGGSQGQMVGVFGTPPTQSNMGNANPFVSTVNTSAWPGTNSVISNPFGTNANMGGFPQSVSFPTFPVPAAYNGIPKAAAVSGPWGVPTGSPIQGYNASSSASSANYNKGWGTPVTSNPFLGGFPAQNVPPVHSNNPFL